MSTTKHTPGPWELDYDKGSTRDILSPKHGGICTVRRAGRHDNDTFLANARLIAAAPEMSDALKAFPAECDYPSAEGYRTACLDWFRNSALPALNKAEGAK